MALKNNWQPLVDGVSEVESSNINKIADSVIELEETTPFLPIIGDNKNWFVWDIDTKTYVDTGYSYVGEKGADGYTPVKGTDYWTEADKQEIISNVSASVTASDITYPAPSPRYDHIGIDTVGGALDFSLNGKTQYTVPSGNNFELFKIYDLGVQTNLTINVPQDSIYMMLYGDWFQVDFVSGETPTNLVINGGSEAITPLDLTIKPNKVYSLFFDSGRVSDTSSGWRISYAEYDCGTV